MMDFNSELMTLIESILGTDELVFSFIRKASLAIKADTYRNRKVADKWMNDFDNFCIEHEIDINLCDLI